MEFVTEMGCDPLAGGFQMLAGQMNGRTNNAKVPAKFDKFTLSESIKYAL
jgi:hypothetical protein